MEHQDLRGWVGGLALAFAAINFLVYLAYSLNWLKASPQKPETGIQAAITRAGDAATTATPAEATEMIKALATLTDSLLKSGPALWSMIGAVLFLLIACLAAGVLVTLG